MDALGMEFERDIDADVTLVLAVGRLDLSTAAIMRRALAKCVAECPAAVVVDMSRCVVATATALAVFPAAVRPEPSRPAVAVLLCGAGADLLQYGGVGALGSVPRYATRAEALRAVETTRAQQRRVFLRGQPSIDLPGDARAAVANACDDWGHDHLTDPATLIISELVTNAINHAAGEITVEAMVRGDFLHLRVRDHSAEPPVARAGGLAPSPQDGGRGLPIVDHYSSAWGYAVKPDRSGKVVWATLRSRPLGGPRLT